MRPAKLASLVLIVALLGAMIGIAGRTGWLRLRLLSRAPTPLAQNAEPPVVEFREAQSGTAGETGSLLTIDRSGQATLQTLPLGPASKTAKTWLTCDELAWLPQELKDDLSALRSSYGTDGANSGEVSVVYRWQGRERSVVWHSPESSPKPPEGQWAALVAPLEEVRRRAQEPGERWLLDTDAIIGYNQSSSGDVGTYSTLLTINKTGRVILRHGLGIGLGEVHEIQLARQELAALVQSFEQEKFGEFRRCYGKHAPVNPQNTYLLYAGDHDGNSVTWMTVGSDPKPPEGWFRIVAILDQIRERAQQTRWRNVVPH